MSKGKIVINFIFCIENYNFQTFLFIQDYTPLYHKKAMVFMMFIRLYLLYNFNLSINFNAEIYGILFRIFYI